MSDMPVRYQDLPIPERIRLVEEIWNSIAEDAAAELPLSPEQRAQLHRRLAEHRADPSSAIPWEQVRAELFKHGPSS